MFIRGVCTSRFLPPARRQNRDQGVSVSEIQDVMYIWCSTSLNKISVLINTDEIVLLRYFKSIANKHICADSM